MQTNSGLCSRSVAANIVEGWAKRISAADFKRHLVIAKGECAETEFWLDLCADEGIAARQRSSPWKSEYGKLGMMIHNLWKDMEEAIAMGILFLHLLHFLHFLHLLAHG